MTLEVFTAPFGIRDPDRLDITMSSSGQRGAFAFAPSSAIEALMHRARRAAERMRDAAKELEAREEGAGTAPRRQADELEEQTWVAFEQRYVAEMRVSYGLAPERCGALERVAIENGVKPDRGAWRALLGRPRVVLVDFYPDPERSARRLLARILAKCGAIDRGELSAPAPPVTHRDVKPANLALEREEIAAGLRDMIDTIGEWRDLGYAG